VTLPVGDPDLEVTPLLDQPLVAVVPKGHRLAKHRKVELSALADEPLLTLDRTTRTGRAVHDHFRSVGFAPHTVLDSGSFEVIKRYVAQGVGWAVLPANAVPKKDADLIGLQVPGLPRVVIGAIRRRDRRVTAIEESFLSLLQDAV
jgi:DNA-binding transcriptional LysR family regulator